MNFRNSIVIETEKGIQETIQITNLTRADRYSNGSLRIDTDNDGAIIRAYKEEIKEA